MRLAQSAMGAPWHTYMCGWMTREESELGCSDGHDLAVKVGRKVIDVRSLAGYKSQT